MQGGCFVPGAGIHVTRRFRLNCTLKSGPQESPTQKLLDQLLRALARHGVTTSSERAVDHDIKPGVSADEGEGDA
jgi:hypothetical protein